MRGITIMKPGDLVMLKVSKDFPDCAGSLTAVKFYKRLINECQDKAMLVLDVFESGTAHHPTRSVTVLVSGYRKVINKNFLRVVSETR